MPRPHRNITPGVHHVSGRGVNKADIFFSDSDRKQYLSHLGSALDKYGVICLAYCLMSNHIHLLVETTRPNLHHFMRSLHGRYADGLNREHGRVGSLFGHRYSSSYAEEAWDVCWFAAYVANNPVKHGFCARPEDWEWSSHRAARGLERGPVWLDVDRLHHWFGDLGADPGRGYGLMIENAGRLGPNFVRAVLAR